MNMGNRLKDIDFRISKDFGSWIDFDKLIPFQGRLVELREKKAEKLIKSIKKAYIDPFLVWHAPDNNIYILAGHQRQKTMKAEGFSGQVPCVKIGCKDKKEAAEFVLKYRSQYGEMTDDGLHEFLNDYNIDFQEIKNEFEPIELNLGTFEMSYYKDIEFDVIEGNLENSGVDHFYQGNSRCFRLGDLLCYIRDENLIEKINKFTNRIIEHDEDQRYLNSIGEKITRLILKNENLFLPK